MLLFWKTILKVLKLKVELPCMHAKLLQSCPILCEPMDWTVAHQAPRSMGFPRQEYWSGLSFPSPGDLPNPGIKLLSPALWVDSLPLSHLGIPIRIEKYLFIMVIIKVTFTDSKIHDFNISFLSLSLSPNDLWQTIQPLSVIIS